MYSNKDMIKLRKPILKKAYVLKPGFNFAALRPYCEDVVYCTDGFKIDVQDVAAQLKQAFVDFNPSEDCVIPSGTNMVNILTGCLLSQNFPGEPIIFGFYLKEKYDEVRGRIPEDYSFYKINVSALLSLSVVEMN